MNTIKEYLKRKKYSFLFISIIIIIGIITGILIGLKNTLAIKQILTNYRNNIVSLSFEGVIIHFSILSFLVISSLFLIGIPFFLLFIFIEGVSIGVILEAFIINFQLKGLIYALIFLSTTYLLFILGIVFLFPKCLEITRNIISKLIYKKDNDIYVLKLLKASLTIVFLILLNDIFLSLVGSKFLNIFHFLIA